MVMLMMIIIIFLGDSSPGLKPKDDYHNMLTHAQQLCVLLAVDDAACDRSSP
jgi:hypothetical protein